MVADPLFGKAVTASLTASEAWIALPPIRCKSTSSFSGYSDMAIGLALMFDTPAPLPFKHNAPYRAGVDPRLHGAAYPMTLSPFMREYLYSPLGGNRCGTPFRRAEQRHRPYADRWTPWHGAGWTFASPQGGLHGVALAVNHVWQNTGLRLPRAAAWAITLLFVMGCWVLVPRRGFYPGRRRSLTR